MHGKQMEGTGGTGSTVAVEGRQPVRAVSSASTCAHLAATLSRSCMRQQWMCQCIFLSDASAFCCSIQHAASAQAAMK
jgi:hypothetical protein